LEGRKEYSFYFHNEILRRRRRRKGGWNTVFTFIMRN